MAPTTSNEHPARRRTGSRARRRRRAGLRGREQQAQDQRQLRQRQRVGAPAHVRVHHEQLGGAEGHRERPPGDPRADSVREEAVDHDDEQHNGGSRHRRGQHGLNTAKRAARTCVQTAPKARL